MAASHFSLKGLLLTLHKIIVIFEKVMLLLLLVLRWHRQMAVQGCLLVLRLLPRIRDEALLRSLLESD